ncbi:MAG TPA: DUF58 domain-containing protein [Burkholderiales bacterium]|nr:DUF58 domain-containing protein [Burkholderiales bacterium]
MQLLRPFTTWLFRLHGPERGEVVLVQRRIFILPSKAGVMFAAVLLLMLTGSINYALSLGFILTFLLGGLAVVAMLHTFRNLAGLRVTAGKAEPVFAGDVARFPIALRNPTRTPRFGLVVARDETDHDIVDVPAEGASVATAAVPAERRGLLYPGRLTLYTRYPVALYRGWSYVDLDTHCVVYPRPAPAGVPLPPLAAGGAEGSGHGEGHDDFYGLRQYHPGDSPRHIAWKAAAREQGLLTKQFTGYAPAELRLSLDSAPPHLPLEDKISRLTRWVLDADAAGIAYALSLPNASIDAATGVAHRERCLHALALV